MWPNEGIKDIINMQPYMGPWARPFKVWKHYLLDQLLNGNNIIYKLNICYELIIKAIILI
ncbi:MAG: hypothetical protein ACKESA_00350 [Candidatus Hodgkinia cicadicola]